MNKIISGIYVIINTSNNKIYVGSSINIKKRINRHFNELRKNIHNNKHLQNAWNKYGEGMFIINVLEEVNNSNDLLKREQYHINTKNASDLMFGYNLCPNASNSLGYKHSEETKEKMCVERKKNSLKYARYGENHWNWNKKLPQNAKNYFRDNHPNYNGDKSPRAKLSNDDVLGIRDLYGAGELSYNNISKIYGVHKRTIGKIVNRERWKHI